MRDSLPTDVLEQRAADQRRQIHATASELRTTVKEKLDVRRNAEGFTRDHFPQAAVAAGVLGLTFGWLVGGAFD